MLVGALAIAALDLPASALAGTYGWNLASDFTATGGANPDHDQYGTRPWSYLESAASASHDPGTFSALPSFSANVGGGLAAWSDSGSGALVGINPTSAPITQGGVTYPAGQIVAEPGSGGRFVAIGWRSPLDRTATIMVSSSLTPDTSGSGLCSYGTAWTLDQNGTPLIQGTTTTSTTSFTTSTSIDPGGSIYLTIATPPADAGCDATEVSLQIQTQATAPNVTVTKPAPGTVVNVGTPAFGGTADTSFGDSGQVTLRIYSGAAATGTPVQTLTTTAVGTAWSITPPTALGDGAYTAQAEQDDRATPSDVGLSPPVKFTVIVGPTVTLAPPGTAPLTTSTPVLTGTAGTAAGDNTQVSVFVFAGTQTTDTPIRKLIASVAANGTYSVRIAPALADGLYTAAATQTDAAGGVGFTPPVTFTIDARAPAVTLVTPGASARVAALSLVFTGRAGTGYGDGADVTLYLYRGKRARGRPLGTITVKAAGSTWTARWARALPAGVYTARALQTDLAGRTGFSAAHTFRVLAPPPVVARTLTIGPTGRVRLRVACNEPPGDTCTGTVLVVTRGEFRPVPGGPAGHMTVVFVHVAVEGGHNHTASSVAPRLVLAALRGHRAVPVNVIANLRPNKGAPIHATVRAVLRQARA